MTHPGDPRVDLAAYEAWLFDMDGVLTKTAQVHAASYKATFDAFLAAETKRTGVAYAPFDVEADYERYVDGEPRENGIRNFLAARGIQVPEGTDDDPPTARTVGGIGNAKNDLFLKTLATDGVAPYDGAIRLVKTLRGRGVKVAVVSSSENTDAALDAAHIGDLFEVRVDGHVLKDKHLAGKPAPDAFLEGARMLGADPDRSVVIEDALAGVAAGHAGDFALVIGVDHHDTASETTYADELRAHGDDVVVRDLGSLVS